MSKASGKLIVGGFVVLLGSAVGIAQVYLPYYSPQSAARREGNTVGKEQKEAEVRPMTPPPFFMNKTQEPRENACHTTSYTLFISLAKSLRLSCSYARL